MKLVQDTRQLDSHDLGPMPDICTLAGLGQDDCPNCPWPECVCGVPGWFGPSPSYHLTMKARQWSAMTEHMKPAMAHQWIRQNVARGMVEKAVPKCKQVLSTPGKYDAQSIEWARTFIQVVESAVAS